MATPPEVIESSESTNEFAVTSNAIAQVAREFADAIRAEGNIRVVFGEPMALDSHKIIPVARVEIGFGGGLGGSASGDGLAEKFGALAKVVRRGFGAGGGGGIKVTPLGFIHEDSNGVQFQGIENGASHGEKD